MRIEIPWGTGRTTVEIADERVAGVLGARVGVATDPDGVLEQALARPEADLDTFLASARSPLLVVVNDATRPTPSADVLRLLRKRLDAWLHGRAGELSLIVATGTHRAALPHELMRIFGADIVRDYGDRVFSHDCRADDQIVSLGETQRGTPIRANRLLAEAASVILINSVEPHYFAGYTGGRKSLFPGLAAYDTVWANHKLSMAPGSEILALAGNPVHEDLEEATALATLGKDVFSIQLVLDRDHGIGFAAAGALGESFARAVEVAERQFVLDIEQRYPVVVAVAPHPMDCNFYQTNKAIQSGALAVAEGGVLIVVSECPFGLGENQTLYHMLAAAESSAAALARADQEEYRLGLQQATRIAGVLQRADIYAVTSLPESQVREMFMEPFGSAQEAVDAALSIQSAGGQVLFLTEASITVPRPRA